MISQDLHQSVVMSRSGHHHAAVIAELEEEMQEAAGRLEFERAALLRDQVNALKSGDYRKSALAPAKEYPKAKANVVGRPKKARR